MRMSSPAVLIADADEADRRIGAKRTGQREAERSRGIAIGIGAVGVGDRVSA